MTDINRQSGIVQVVSVLEYDDSIFEVVFDNDPNIEKSIAEQGSVFEGFKVLYSETKQTNETVNSKGSQWFLLYNQNNGYLCGMTSRDPQVENGIIGKIKLKVKNGAKAGATKIFMKNTEVRDNDMISNTESDNEAAGDLIGDSEIELQINASRTNPPSPSSPSGGNQGSSRGDASRQENIAKGEVPNSGIEDVLPFIFITIIIVIISYISYRKYKNV